MEPLWNLLTGGGAGPGEIGQLIALGACLFVFIGVFVPLLILIKALGARNRSGQPQSTIREGLTETMFREELEQAMSQAKGETPQAAAQAQPESREQFVADLEKIKRTGLQIYSYLMYAIVAVLVGAAIYVALNATAANGLVLAAILLFALAGLVFVKMEEFLQMLTSRAAGSPLSFTISRNVTIGKPTVLRMDQAALDSARDLMRAGKDLDSICRQVEPDYAGWGSLEQMMFRETMQAVLKSGAQKAGAG